MSLVLARRVAMLMGPVGILLSIFEYSYPRVKGYYGWQLTTVGVVCALQLLFYKLCRVIANRHIATMMPSW